MSKPLRILHLEDDQHDAELVKATLAADRLVAEIVRVETREAFVDAIENSDFDLILADYQLPAFDGLSAQAIAAELRPGTPFIFLSGTIGEELAVERLKAGATDYVLKQRIAKLPSSVRRALAEAEERAERRSAELEVRRLNAELEERVAARTAELELANAARARREADLRDAKSLLEDLVASSPSMIFRVDASDLRITYASPNIGWILGYTVEDVIGIPAFWDRLIHPDDRGRVTTEISAAIDADDVQIEQEYRLRNKDGRYCWFYSLTRVEYDSPRHPVTMLRYCLDIEERRKADDAVKIAHLEAERANLAKSEFLSRMSHELRTPLNAVLGFAQLLEADSAGAEQLENVQQILRGGRHLLGLINEVLDIARIEAGHLSLSPEPVDVGEIAAHAVALVAPLGVQRRVTLSIDPAPAADRCVRADRQRLNQVLLNLLSNGVKYTRAGGHVTVGFEVQADRRMRVTVSDTGAGIAPEKLDLLFTPFERLGAERTTVEGTGLGLALARGLAHAMGGTLGVSSVVDVGSTFWVELPLSNDQLPAQTERTPRRTLDAASGAGTVLYIEDNVANVRLMQRVLQRRTGVKLLHAGEGRRGVEMARESHPDLILLDLHLPDLPGEEVLRRLWEDPVLRAIPVAVLSADATPGQSRRLLAAGARAYLTKPLDVSQVLQLVDELLVRPRAEIRQSHSV